MIASSLVRAVYDCGIFVQGLGRRNTVARKCLDLIDAGSVKHCMSPSTLSELRDVLGRPEILRRFPLIESAASRDLLAILLEKSLLLSDVRGAFALPRDRDDQAYTDLAIAARAPYLVTWNDRHLTYLMRRDTPEGVDFCNRYPAPRILNPPEFVRAIEAQP